MKSLQIWVDYRPNLYQELILKVLGYMSQSEAGVSWFLHSGVLKDHREELRSMDIILHSMEQIVDEPVNPNQPDAFTQAVRIAFSPKGNQGWVRWTPQEGWERMRPFGLQELLGELLEMTGHEL